MQVGLRTTTLSELNRLYWMYFEAKTANSIEADKAWIDYEVYAWLYQAERGLKITLEPRRPFNPLVYLRHLPLRTAT